VVREAGLTSFVLAGEESFVGVAVVGVGGRGGSEEGEGKDEERGGRGKDHVEGSVKGEGREGKELVGGWRDVRGTKEEVLEVEC
jgi:hypothetical protein